MTKCAIRGALPNQNQNLPENEMRLSPFLCCPARAAEQERIKAEVRNPPPVDELGRKAALRRRRPDWLFHRPETPFYWAFGSQNFLSFGSLIFRSGSHLFPDPHKVIARLPGKSAEITFLAGTVSGRRVDTRQ